MIRRKVLTKPPSLRTRAPLRQTRSLAPAKILTNTMKNSHSSNLVRCRMRVVGLSLSIQLLIQYGQKDNAPALNKQPPTSNLQQTILSSAQALQAACSHGDSNKRGTQ
jgi:hypothetical protein